MAKQRIFSGEPLPVPPNLKNPEADSFNRKLIDYLRRLSAKIDRFTGGGDGADGNVLVFAAYKSSTQSISDSAFDPITWDEVIRRDSIFTFTPGSAIIEVSETGFYVVEMDIMMFKNVTLELKLSTVDAGGTEIDDIDYGYSEYSPSLPNLTLSVMIPVELNAGDRISLFGLSQLMAGANDVINSGTRLLISRISAEVA
jgi:hypothetical protein